MQSTHDFMHHRRSVLMGLASFTVGGVGAATGLPAWAQAANSPQVIRVAAASDLKFALAQLGARFEAETGLKLAVTYGSSGNLARQLEQGLPMDLFLSADEALIFRLAKALWARDEGVVYGRGRLAWLLPKSSAAVITGDLTGLGAALGEGGKLSIANPDHAPYGRAARAALQAAGLWPALQSRLVLGENVSQATQFVSTGAAQVGLIALSLALAPEVAGRTLYGVVDASLHPPIIQRMALHRSASSAAQRFYAFLQTADARKVLVGHGLG
jgi:molybdate transport system substrate-binding protein